MYFKTEYYYYYFLYQTLFTLYRIAFPAAMKSYPGMNSDDRELKQIISNIEHLASNIGWPRGFDELNPLPHS